MCNILSIDMDFFLDFLTEDKKNMYLNVKHFSIQYSNILKEINKSWVELYKQIDYGVLDVNIDKYDFISDYVNSKKFKTIVIADSHEELYKYIIGNNIDVHNLINIDLHHDIYYSNDVLDCGNWLYKLINLKKNLNPIWIYNEYSDFYTGIDIFDEKYFANNIIKAVDDIKICNNYDFDILFLCKSSAWVPPHIDSYFLSIIDSLKKNNIVFIRGNDFLIDRNIYLGLNI